jgi:hypothetical protein
MKFIDIDENEGLLEPEEKVKKNNVADVEANLEHLYELAKKKHARMEENRQKNLAEKEAKKRRFENVEEEKLQLQTFQRPKKYDDDNLDVSDDEEDEEDVVEDFNQRAEDRAQKIAESKFDIFLVI